MESQPQSIVLDTDIGSDVDDILALAMIIGSPELRLCGVTTVYGDVKLRAQLAARAIRSTGGPPVPVVPGRGDPLSGRPVWWAGHEGGLMDDLDTETIQADQDPTALLGSVDTVIAIGPLSNAAGLADRPGRTEQLYVMGGDFGPKPRVEHNIRCDAKAAEMIFDSGLETTVIGLDQTERVRIDAAALGQISDSGDLGQLLAAEIRQFWRFAGKDYNVPHDPLAVLSLVRPDLFSFQRGRISITATAAEPDEALTTFTPDESGPHRIVTDLDTGGCAEEILRRIITAATSSPLTEEKT